VRSMISARRGRLVLTFGVAASLLAAACGSSSSTSNDTTAAAAATTQAAATTAAADTTVAAGADTTVAAADTTAPAATADKSPVLIASLVDLTGPSTGPANMPDLIKAWGDYINAKGGLNGHPVTFDIQDTKSDAATAQSELDAMVAKKPVLILLESSATEAALAASLAATNIPVMGVGYAPAVWGGYIEAFKLACSADAGAPVACALPNAFPLATTFGAVVDEQVLGAKAAGATKLATAACAEIEACSQAEPVFAATATAVGVADTGAVKVDSTKGDYSAECIQWIQQGVDFIQISGSSALGASLFSSCTDQGYTGIFGASAGSVSGDLIATKGITLAGGINGFPWWVDDAPVKEYADAMKAGGITDLGIAGPSGTVVWSALQLFAKANATLSDAPTAAETLKNMFTVKDETLDGLIAPVTFTEGQPAKSRDCFWPYILKDGKFTNPLGGLKFQCYPDGSTAGH